MRKFSTYSNTKEVEYELNLKRVKKLLKEVNAKRVLLQMPNGLKRLSSLIIDELEKINIEVILDSGHAWGICDLPLHRAKLVGADTVIHYGHLDLKEYIEIDRIKVIVVPAYYKREISFEILKELVRTLKPYKRIGLSSSIQHIKELLRIGRYLKSKGFIVYMGKSKIPGFKTGQVTGCDLSASLLINNYVDVHVCISGGIFHAIGIAIATNKATISLDPYKGVIEHSRIEEFLRKVLAKKLYNLMVATEAKNFGVIISQKLGQYKLALALKIKKELERNDRKVILIALDEVEPTTLANISNVEVFVNTACPRLGIDELELFKDIILINSGEIEYVISGNLDNYTLKKAISWGMNLNFMKAITFL